MENTNKTRLAAEGLYGHEACVVMTDAEAEKLWQLHQTYNEAFDAACDEYVSTLGLEKSQLSDQQKADIIDQVGDLMEEYEAADTDGRCLKEVTPLMLCLKRYHDLGLEIMNIRDDLVARCRVNPAKGSPSGELPGLE